MIDWTKPIETVDGRPSRVLATDIKRGDEFTIAITWPNDDGTEGILLASTTGGTRSCPGKPQVRNKPVKREGWTAVYLDKHSPSGRYVDANIFATKQEAENCCTTDERIATVRVEWEEAP